MSTKNMSNPKALELDCIKHQDKTTVKNILEETLGGDSYHNKNPQIAHPSSSGGCKRRDYLNYLFELREDLEPPRNSDKSEKTFWLGDVIHEDIQERIQEKYGAEKVSVEEPIEIQLDDEVRIEGHADLVLRDIDELEENIVVDIKTAKQFKYYDKNEGEKQPAIPKRQHFLQLNTYLHALDIEKGVVLYVNKQTGSLEEFSFDYQKELWQEARQYLKTVLDHVDQKKPAPKTAEPHLCSDTWCKYYREGVCSGVNNSKVPTSDQLDSQLITEKELTASLKNQETD